MDILLKKKVDLMVDNYYKLKDNFKWEENLLKHFGAMVHATKGLEVDSNAIEEIKKYIKLETSCMSYFRGTNLFIMSNLLYFEANYKAFFNEMMEVYEKLKNSGFYRSEYLPLAAYTLVKEVPSGDWNYRIERMNKFYESMRKNHFWLTSHDDYVFAAVLATTDLNIQETSGKIEECYKLLNSKGLYKGNPLQTLSHILAIGEESVEEKCNKAIKIYEELSDKKCKLKYNGLASLGVLTLITSDVDKIVNEVKEVYDYLYKKDGYGFWSLENYVRTMMASNLVADYYVEGIKKGIFEVALSNSINAIIIAQQQAAVAAACSAGAAAAASSSGS